VIAGVESWFRLRGRVSGHDRRSVRSRGQSISSGATAYWVPEKAAIPVTEQVFAQDVILTPKALAALVPVSNRLLRDEAKNPSKEAVVRADISESARARGC
jgi:HK97 family phage major capsid protein